MCYYAVTRNAGPAWTNGKGAIDQPGAVDHAAFMDTLAADGVVLCAGPLASSENKRIRVLLIADAPSEADIRRRLADDPWELTRQVVTTSIEPWNLFVGAQRLSHGPATTL